MRGGFLCAGLSFCHHPAPWFTPRGVNINTFHKLLIQRKCLKGAGGVPDWNGLVALRGVSWLLGSGRTVVLSCYHSVFYSLVVG